MNKAERVQSTRKNARRQGSFRGGISTDTIPAAQPNQSQTDQTCPLGQELITGPDGKKRCGTKRPRIPSNKGL